MSLPPCIFLPHFFKNKVPIGAWVYFRGFYVVPLVYISVFVTTPCCLDDCSFVVKSEVKKVDSCRSILLSQDCFGYFGSFVFPYELWNFCPNSVKNAIFHLIGSYWICRLHLVVLSFSQYWFFLPWNMEYLSMCLCHHWFLPLVSYNFLCTLLLSP